jgi:hypothetical protein
MKKCKKEKVEGKWQDYYDQAMMVELDNDIRFITNFRYEIKANLTKGREIK